MRDIDPALCYVLPGDRDRVARQMDGKQLWVAKRAPNPAVLTAFNSHNGVWAPEGGERSWYNELQFHKGGAVQFITALGQLPSIDGSSQAGVIVQPFFRPFLGAGCMARKWELRAFASVASITPPRFYLYRDLEVIVARKLYDTAASGSDDCMHDTHLTSAKGDCYDPCLVDVAGWPNDGRFNRSEGTNAKGRKMSLSTYTRLASVPSNTTAALVHRIRGLLSRVFHHPDTLAGFADNPITSAIEASGASCFHWLRVDMGVTEALEPVIFEINNSPETSDSQLGRRGPRYQSHRQLFHMLELDKPTRLPRAERGKWELENAGGWWPILP